MTETMTGTMTGTMTERAHRISRRGALGLAATALAGTALGGLWTAPAAAAAPGLPPVPGMQGDRYLNEFWYQFDEAVGYRPSPELLEANGQISAHVGGNLFAILERWLEHVRAPGYPHTFARFLAPVRDPLRVVSRTELGVFDAFFRRHDPRLVSAFAAFAQGLLFDPRRANVELEVHTMDGVVAYHVWHVYARSMMLLGIDGGRWREIDPLIGFGWAVQSVALPQLRTVNPPLPEGQVRDLAREWLPRTPQRLDAAFQSFPYPWSGPFPVES
ncbi:hypothetical protein KZZ52_32475 [Dactylosporangium sp. AC04546]|uniref:hypothetical protein n=1 Tax=Dactylosporangium sp. AC04546 TaxID=2862460 RepID=UPI001EDD94D6|nr:hypothetical protein [Dactylosporangium sp. AC04546]WVK78708.1 hypothetical protein KZZ52_32475 [Dactylosporangium sp. AC04546]